MMKSLSKNIKAAVFAIDRLRMGTDGTVITTLVTFMGCPLRCKYCVNSRCHEPIYEVDGKTLRPGIMLLTPQQLYDRVKIDNIYFQLTGGGVCFGGREPALQSDFIDEFRKISEFNEYAPYNKRIEIAIYAPDKIEREPSKRFRAFIINRSELGKQLKWLNKNGVMYFTWRRSRERCKLPIKGENVVVMRRRCNDTIMYLMKVIAVDDEAKLFLKDTDNLKPIDFCYPYIFSNISGLITLPNWSLTFLEKEPVGEQQPNRFLSESAQSILEQIFGLK